MAVIRHLPQAFFNRKGKYGTPRCEFIAQLVKVEEPENASLGGKEKIGTSKVKVVG